MMHGADMTVKLARSAQDAVNGAPLGSVAGTSLQRSVALAEKQESSIFHKGRKLLKGTKGKGFWGFGSR
jgi:hypothetical protein